MISIGMKILLSGVLGIVFLAAAIPKLRHPRGFVLAVLEYRVLPTGLSWFYARLIPPLEFLLALLLLTGTAVLSAAIVTLLLLLSFIAAVGINLVRGRDLDCNCFGKAKRPIGWKLVLQDTALLGAAIVLATMGRNWLGVEPWSVFRLAGLMTDGGLRALLVCLALTISTGMFLSRSKQSKRWSRSEVVSKYAHMRRSSTLKGESE